MEDRPLVGTTGWQQHPLVLDVADAAAASSFGAGLSRVGEMLAVASWPSRRSATMCRSPPAPMACGHPQNLDFSEAYG